MIGWTLGEEAEDDEQLDILHDEAGPACSFSRGRPPPSPSPSKPPRRTAGPAASCPRRWPLPGSWLTAPPHAAGLPSTSTLKTQPPLLTHGDDQRRIWNHRERRPGGARAGRKRRDSGGDEVEGGARGVGEGWGRDGGRKGWRHQDARVRGRGSGKRAESAGGGASAGLECGRRALLGFLHGRAAFYTQR